MVGQFFLRGNISVGSPCKTTLSKEMPTTANFRALFLCGSEKAPSIGHGWSQFGPAGSNCQNHGPRTAARAERKRQGSDSARSNLNRASDQAASDDPESPVTVTVARARARAAWRQGRDSAPGNPTPPLRRFPSGTRMLPPPPAPPGRVEGCPSTVTPSRTRLRRP
jgi:hypothetical protein